MTSHVFLAGASRGVGREIAKCLTAQGIKVTGLARSSTTHQDLEAMGVNVVTGDALDAETIEQLMLNAAPVDAVISTIGGKPTDGERADFKGNKHLY